MRWFHYSNLDCWVTTEKFSVIRHCFLKYHEATKFYQTEADLQYFGGLYFLKIYITIWIQERREIAIDQAILRANTSQKLTTYLA